MPTLDTSDDRFQLAQADDWFAGESAEFRFQIAQNGDPVDITEMTVGFRVQQREYDTSAVVFDGDTDGVEIIDEEPLGDPEVGEFTVRIDAAVTDDVFGENHIKITLDAGADTNAEWRARVLVTA